MADKCIITCHGYTGYPEEMDPFGSYFDTTFVYGPIFGSSYYAGLRYKLN